MDRYLNALSALRLDIQQFNYPNDWDSCRDLMTQIIQREGVPAPNPWDGCIPFSQELLDNPIYAGDIGVWKRCSSEGGGQWEWCQFGNVIDDTSFEGVAKLSMKEGPGCTAWGTYFFHEEDLQWHIKTDFDSVEGDMDSVPPFNCHNRRSSEWSTLMLDSPYRSLLV